MTLIELLVVLGIISILAALLIPAALSARHSSRRASCLNNLRQIGLALQAYHGDANCLPQGRFLTYDPRYAGSNPPCTSRIVDKSFLVQILPHLEQLALYNAVNQSLTIFGRENTTVWAVSVGAFACPSDPGAGEPRVLDSRLLAYYQLPDPTPPEVPYRVSYTSYSGGFGSVITPALPQESNHCVVPGAATSQNDGCFNDLSPITFASITDGLGQTILATEKATDSFRALDDAGGTSPQEYNRFGWYVSGNRGGTLFTGMYPPNSYKLGGVWDAIIVSASSYHAGGVNVLMADGSARFFKETVQSWPIDFANSCPVGASRNLGGWWQDLPPEGVWQALCTRSGNELISPDAL